MPVKIRLSRVGKKHAPFYRIVSVDSRRKRDSSFLEDLGTYDTINSVVVRFDEEGYKRRLEQGAIATDSVKKIYLMFKQGITEQALKDKKIEEKVSAPKKAKPAKAKEEVKEAKAPEPTAEAPAEKASVEATAPQEETTKTPE